MMGRTEEATSMSVLEVQQGQPWSSWCFRKEREKLSGEGKGGRPAELVPQGRTPVAAIFFTSSLMRGIHHFSST